MTTENVSEAKASKAYADNVTKIYDLIDSIRESLICGPAPAGNARNATWGHVGNLQEAIAKLREADSWLNGKGGE